MYVSKLKRWFGENNGSNVARWLVVIAVALTMFGAHDTARAGGGAGFRFQGKTAIAFFSSADESGCIVTDVYVWGSDAIESPTPGSGSPTSRAYVILSRYDVCTETHLLEAMGMAELSDADFQVSKQYESATLHTPMTVYDYESGNSFDVQVDLAWTGFGDLSHETTHFTNKTASCLNNVYVNGMLRPAEVSGTVSDGVTNFTPEAASYGETGSVKSGHIEICNY